MALSSPGVVGHTGCQWRAVEDWHLPCLWMFDHCVKSCVSQNCHEASVSERSLPACSHTKKKDLWSKKFKDWCKISSSVCTFALKIQGSFHVQERNLFYLDFTKLDPRLWPQNLLTAHISTLAPFSDDSGELVMTLRNWPSTQDTVRRFWGLWI